MKTKKMIIVGAATIGVLLIAILVLLGVRASSFSSADTSFAGRISAGQKYLNTGEYDKAIIEFKAALELDETDERVYVGLYDAYMGADYISLARRIVVDGIQITNSAILRERLVKDFPEMVILLDGPEIMPTGAANEVIKTNRVSPVLNVELLQFLSGASFKDYTTRYADLHTHMENGVCIAETSYLDAEIQFYDTSTLRVINTTSGMPYPEMLPNAIVFKNLQIIFGGAPEVSYDNLRLMNDVTSLSKDDSRITFQAAGCVFSVACDENYVFSCNTENQIVPTGSNETHTDHNLNGTIIDATTGKTINAVEMVFHAHDSGQTYSAETDSLGRYSIETSDSGRFTIELKKDGYISEEYDIYVAEEATEAKNDFAISPMLGEEEIRIVLTWGAAPTDLDSHLYGTSSDGTNVHVSFMEQIVMDKSGQKIAELDIDDLDSYGPETTTIYDTNGSFTFAVEDYTHTIGVGPSGASVKIYQGNTLLYTLTPDGDIGNVWTVCSIEHGQISILDY